jgi:SPP1 family predicted phage head-tail adaptor
MVPAGELNKRITIEEPVGTIGASGEVTRTWGTIASVSAKIESLTGQETAAARLIDATTSHRVTIRWRPGLSPKMRLVYDSRVFNIGSMVNTDERNEDLVIDCTEVV